jgi:hypothetical protein
MCLVAIVDGLNRFLAAADGWTAVCKYVQEAQVQLRSSGLRGNGLFCTHAVDEGAVVLRIPLDACLVFQRDPEQARPSPYPPAPSQGPSAGVTQAPTHVPSGSTSLASSMMPRHAPSASPSSRPETATRRSSSTLDASGSPKMPWSNVGRSE